MQPGIEQPKDRSKASEQIEEENHRPGNLQTSERNDGSPRISLGDDVDPHGVFTDMGVLATDVAHQQIGGSNV